MIGPRGQMRFRKGARQFIWYQNRAVEIIVNEEDDELPSFKSEEKIDNKIAEEEVLE